MSNPTYDDIMSAITASAPEDWIDVGDVTGGGSAIFKPDPRISVTMASDGEDRAYSESWANVHPDSVRRVSSSLSGSVAKSSAKILESTSTEGGRH